MKKIYIVEDHPLFSVGLMEIINDEDDLSVCGNSDNVPDALGRIRSMHPDLVIADITLKNSNGLELVKELKKSCPGIPVLVLSMHPESLYAERVILAGAKGYVMKQEAPKNVIKAIHALLDNKTYISDAVNEALLDWLRSPTVKGGRTSPLERLTLRELEVFELIGQGLTTKQIAVRMNLSMKTIGTYKDRIKTKLGFGNINELIAFAARWHAG